MRPPFADRPAPPEAILLWLGARVKRPVKGSPEKPGRRRRAPILRRLTALERALGGEMFGEALELARVRILAIPVWRRAFVAGRGLIVWPAAELPDDFGAAPLELQATFIHELTHVWQAQTGVSLLLAKLKAGDSAAAYAYDLSLRPDFTALNIEQQAMVVEHAFLASRGGQAPHSPALYAETSAAWRRG